MKVLLITNTVWENLGEPQTHSSLLMAVSGGIACNAYQGIGNGNCSERVQGGGPETIA